MSNYNDVEATSFHRQKSAFQVVSNNQPATLSFPSPAAGDPLAPQYYPSDYQTAPPGYAEEERPLPCGIGMGWILFILGFFLCLPWYIGAILVGRSKMDRREKPGLVACTVAAAITTFLLVITASVMRHIT